MLDFSLYDERIGKLYTAYKEHAQRSDPDAIRVVNKLLAASRAIRDDKLTGLAHYLMAFECYFTFANYDAFLKHGYQAAKHFVRSGDEYMMKHIYYLVAIDALNKGLYDIAYSYNARLGNIVRENGEKTASAIADLTTGLILIRVGAYREARKHIRQGFLVIKKDTGHPHYYYNMMSVYLNDGTTCLKMGNLREAERLYRAAERFASQHGAFVGMDLRCACAQLGCAVAAAGGTTHETEERTNAMLAAMREATQISDSMEDITGTCRLLLERGNFKSVERCLKIIEQKSIAPDAALARRALVDLKVDFFMAAGKKKALAECFLEQDAVYERVRIEQQKSYRFVKDLVALADELQKEREHIRMEHEALLKKAETDELTRIANRRKMNRHMEEAFDAAFKNRTRLGVCILDVDDLKAYNDKYGHAAGDRLLTEAAKILSLLEKDSRIFAARYGGDEFVLIIEQMTDREIRNAIGMSRLDRTLSVSVGVCNAIPKETDRSHDFLALADKALYEAKRARKGSKKNKATVDSCIRFRKPVPVPS